jgi:hypothetical protein
MKNRLLLIAVLSAIMFQLHAQTKDLKNTSDVVFNGHTIRAYKTIGTGYGYDIFYNNNLLIHQNNNPFTGSPEGLKNKEDALKLAKWQVIHLNPVSHQLPSDLQTVPKEVAQQLKIAIN